MYAVIQTGGKQYRVAAGDVITVERLTGEPGGSITFDHVLMLGEGDSPTIGKPTVDGATVSATVLEQARGPKIIVFKKKRRKGYRRTAGHRQDLTVLRITDVSAAGAKKVAFKAKPAAKAEAAKKAESRKPEAKAEVAEKTEEKKAVAKEVPEKKAAPKASAAKKAPVKKAEAKKPAADTESKE